AAVGPAKADSEAARDRRGEWAHALGPEAPVVRNPRGANPARGPQPPGPRIGSRLRLDPRRPRAPIFPHRPDRGWPGPRGRAGAARSGVHDRLTRNGAAVPTL